MLRVLGIVGIIVGLIHPRYDRDPLGVSRRAGARVSAGRRVCRCRRVSIYSRNESLIHHGRPLSSTAPSRWLRVSRSKTAMRAVRVLPR